MLHFAHPTIGALLALLFVGPTPNQCVEEQNDCAGGPDDPCVRIGSCSIQGATWDMEVMTDRGDVYDTGSWESLCDRVYLGLTQGQCAPSQGQTDVIVYLPLATIVRIPMIVGELNCEAIATADSLAALTNFSLEVRPNPFCPSTGISFTAPSSLGATLSVVDSTGRRVRVLYNGATRGEKQFIKWNGVGKKGQAAPTGVYWIVLEAGALRLERRAEIVR